VTTSTHQGAVRELDTFATASTLRVGPDSYAIHRITDLAPVGLPVTLKIVLENLLRHQDDDRVDTTQIRHLLDWGSAESFRSAVDLSPSRVFLHDTNGVPTVVDIAAMRDAAAVLGGDPAAINPSIPAELVIDHSVIADVFGRPDAFDRNVEIEYSRNSERYRFLRWGQQALDRFAVVPPGTGIMHQVNTEYLSRVVMTEQGWAFPDVCLGTDSHTTMVNGLGVLAWGIGGIEAEAVMLGQSLSMLLPPVVGFRLFGRLPDGATATDLVLTVTEKLRRHGVVGKFVEFYGPGVAETTLADRVTISNMSPEFGSTCAYFPIDDETLRYLRFTGRPEWRVNLVEAYAKEQGLWHDPTQVARYTELVELDLASVVPSLAGPRRPQDRVPLTAAKSAFRNVLNDVLPAASPAEEPAARLLPSWVDEASAESFPASDAPAIDHADGAAGVPARVDTTPEPHPRSRPTDIVLDGTSHRIDHGSVAIAAITSCTNTSNPTVMVAAALLARNAVDAGLTSKPWVKTSLSPGSKVVTDYFDKAGLTPYLEKLGFHLAGYGCMTCIGASGPLIDEVSAAVTDNDLAVVSVLSGNRNFDGRINPEVRMNYLASPPLVIAYALAGTMDIDLGTEPLGHGPTGAPVYLRDLWPDGREVQDVIDATLNAGMFATAYADVFTGDDRWRALDAPTGDTFDWDPDSTYVRRPPYLDGLTREPSPVTDITGARVLVQLGDSVTTDHVSPAGAIPPRTAAGRYLTELGVPRFQLNTYASRRGNHEVMMRGCFANVRLRNQLVPGVEGGYTRNFLDDTTDTVYDAALRYRDAGVPLLVVAGKDYGSGSSRDWAAKGPALLGIRAVLAESFERIHRSNLVGMGVLPLQFLDGQSAASLGLTGTETFTVTGLPQLDDGITPDTLTVHADAISFAVRVRLDTPRERDYYRHGGIMKYVLRHTLA
jgi:aconitate hydratase